jgi:hypothetical protein
MSSGINGTYRIFLPTARFFGTLTARGMNDEIAQIAMAGDTPAETILMDKKPIMFGLFQPVGLTCDKTKWF